MDGGTSTLPRSGRDRNSWRSRWADGSLRYIGSAGTGFTDRARRVLYSALQQLQVPDPPMAGSVPGEVAGAERWVVPVIVADIECREVSAEGLLRHPSFRGVRADRDAAEVAVLQPYPVSRIRSAVSGRVTIGSGRG
ncbi:hypothetical protein ACFXG4_50015 [Nocardia sp. NPDC059246]|uniref:ATP dependent DNA ligase n=1 Tax=unclassified Nocardia TaxID=2637762 RepID=UPI0036989B5C